MKYPQVVNHSNRHWLLFAIICMVFLINLDYTAVNLILSPMAKELDTDLNTIQWALAVYVLAWSACLIPAGWLTDRFGQKRLVLLGCAYLPLHQWERVWPKLLLG